MRNELRNRIIEIIRFTNRQVSSDVPIYGSDEAADMILEVIGKRNNPSPEEQCLYTLDSEPTKPWFDMIPLSEEEKKRRIDDFPRRFKAAAEAFARKVAFPPEHRSIPNDEATKEPHRSPSTPNDE